MLIHPAGDAMTEVDHVSVHASLGSGGPTGPQSRTVALAARPRGVSWPGRRTNRRKRTRRCRRTRPRKPRSPRTRTLLWALRRQLTRPRFRTCPHDLPSGQVSAPEPADRVENVPMEWDDVLVSTIVVLGCSVAPRQCGRKEAQHVRATPAR